MKPVWVNAVEKLARQGYLASSEIPQSIRKELEEWGISLGCCRIVKQGRGTILQVSNSAILENYIKSAWSSQPQSEERSRANNIARFRDSKVGDARHKTSYCLLKSLGTNIMVKSAQGPLALSEHVQALGCLALPLTDESIPWSCELPLFMIENQALFDDVSWLPQHWEGILLYYQGQIPQRLIRWLAKCQFAAITLFPDYDGVGVQNFLKLNASVPNAQWYWRRDWQAALVQFGNPDLWAKDEQRKAADAAWTRWEQNGWPDPQLRDLLLLMRTKGLMLEQEWVLFEG